MAELYLGTIVATTTAKSNEDTAAPFTIPQNNRIVLQPDVAGYALTIKSGGTAVTANTGVKVQADATWETTTTEDRRVVSCVSVAGTMNVKVWAVL